jgi:translocation and assembly module TamB
VLVLLVLVGANMRPGQALIARLAPRLTGGLVTIDGLSGRFPDRLHAAQLSLHDKDGIWARIDDLDLDWSPLRLVAGEIAVHRIAVTKIDVLHRPNFGGSSSSYRFAIDIEDLHVGRLNIAAPVTGNAAASLALDGAAAITATRQGRIVLTANGVSAPGDYHLDASLGAADLDLRLNGQEPPHGLVSGIAGLPDIGALSIDSSLNGPLSAIAVKLRLSAGALRGSAHGTVDLAHHSADLGVTATAPAMTPRSDLSWQSVAFDAKIDGPLARPEVSGKLDIAALKAAQASVARITANIQGNSGAARLQAALAGIRIPGPHPELLPPPRLRLRRR